MLEFRQKCASEWNFPGYELLVEPAVSGRYVAK